MKKIVAILTALMLCAAFMVPAFAADDFVPSVTNPLAPEIVPIPDPDGVPAAGVIEIDDEIIEYVYDCLVVTPVSKAEESELIPDDARELLLEVYEKLTSGEMEIPYWKHGAGLDADDMVIRDLFDFTFLCEEHPEMLEPAGVTFRITFDLGVEAGVDVYAMTYHYGEWDPVVSCTNNNDGSVTVVAEHFCPIEFSVEVPSEEPDEPTCPEWPTLPEWPTCPDVTEPEWPTCPDVTEPEWPTCPDVTLPECPTCPDLPSWPEWDWPEWDWPEWDWPEWDWPELPDCPEWPEWDWPTCPEWPEWPEWPDCPEWPTCPDWDWPTCPDWTCPEWPTCPDWTCPECPTCPEVTEPEVTEPEVTEPEVTEPETTEPEVTEPEATEPEVTEPEVTEPEVTEPEATEPEAPETEATEAEKPAKPVDPPVQTGDIVEDLMVWGGIALVCLIAVVALTIAYTRMNKKDDK